jgi:3-keto steroid reductase
MNSGVGYGICQRLLSQMSQRCPSDSSTTLNRHHNSAEPRISSSGPLRSLHLIMACRNLKKAETAKSKLLHWFEKTVKVTSPMGGLNSEQIEFFEKLRVQILPLDLASVQSTFAFCKQVIEKCVYSNYPPQVPY